MVGLAMTIWQIPRQPIPSCANLAIDRAAGSLEGQASYDLPRDWHHIVGDSPFERGAAEWAPFYHFASAAEAETPAWPTK